jgi:hypothetical protein
MAVQREINEIRDARNVTLQKDTLMQKVTWKFGNPPH